VADFIFLRCGSTCPVMTEAMAGLAKKLQDVPEARFLSFDVDPEHDGVADLAAFAKERGASALRWTFVHGKDRSTIRSLSRDGFHLAVEDGTAEDPEPILHSTRFVLVDRKGTIRGTYDGTDPAAVETLAWDVRRLSKGV
jgi:protein SCO1/2